VSDKKSSKSSFDRKGSEIETKNEEVPRQTSPNTPINQIK